MVQRRDSLKNVSIEVTVIVLREVQEVGRPIVVHSYIDARKFVQAYIVVTNGADDWKQVS